jgi:peptidoglycan/LPS O-acetylase OafA/YrhL
MSPNYIREIQSLRGISIILVFLFHLNQEIFSYGYLGVDVFFVISGFIITKIIHQNLIENKFSIKVFFISRFLRLIPSLFFMVIIVSFLIIATYQLHANPNTLVNTGLSSLIGLSNFYLIFIENDYFNSFDENIFEHMWSLSIEFQFYFFYPIFLIVLIKLFKNNINFYIYLYLIIIFFFILFNIFFGFEYFYHTGSRIGELLIGCFAFFLYQKKGGNYYYILLLSIIFLIIHLFYLNIFYLIMSVCFLTSFIIISLSKLIFLKKTLNNKFLLFFGDTSYSLYLWHLPVIFFTNIFLVGFDYYFFSITISLIISFLSFKFIEKPFRKSGKIRNFTITKIFTLKKISFVVFTFIIFFIYIDFTNSKNKILTNQKLLFENLSSKLGFFNFPEMDDILDQTCHEKYGQIIFQSDCFEKNNNDQLIYFFGDSSMLDFFQSFKDRDPKIDKLFSSYNNSSFWKPTMYNYSTTNAATIGLSENLELLTKQYRKVFLVLSFNHNFNYISVNKSKKYYRSQEKVYLELIKTLPKNVKLIFIKDTPQFKYTERNCFIIQKFAYSFFDYSKNNSKCDHEEYDILKKMSDINEMFNNLKSDKNFAIINLDDYFCENKKCLFYKVINASKFAKKTDSHHFTTHTSKNITKIFNKRINQVILEAN